MPPPQTRSIVMLASRAASSRRVVPLGRDRADERVARDPVRAPGEDRHAVEHEAEEARAPLLRVGRLVERERADTDLPLVPVELVVAVEQRHGQVVERRLAQVVRPPEPGLLDRAGRRSRRRLVRVRSSAEIAGIERRLRRRRRRQRDSGGERPATGEPLGFDSDGDQRPVVRSATDPLSRSASRRSPRAAFAPQLDRPPDPDGRQARTPVPAVAELGFAHRGRARDSGPRR